MRTIIIPAIIALTLDPAHLPAQPGSLDLNFDGDGIVTTPISEGPSQGEAVVVQPNGRILVAGYVNDNASYNVVLVRYMPDGSLDNSFGTLGKTITPAHSLDPNSIGLALQPDGRIVVACDINGDMAVLRYTSAGILDPTFGGDGVVTTSFSSGTDVATAVALQPDGKIVAAGYTTGTNEDFALARYNTDGTLDDTFSFDGKVTTAISGNQNDAANTVAIAEDGGIITAGYVIVSGGEMAVVVRYTADGTLDDNFVSNGIAQLTIGSDNISEAYSMALQADGRILLGLSVYDTGNYRFAAARLNSNGMFDTSFAGDGMQITPLPGGSAAFCYGLALQADGKAVLTGVSNYDVALVRYATDGTLDFSFGTAGIVVTDAGIYEAGLGIIMQADGKILVVGYSSNQSMSDILLLRYDSGVNIGIAEVGDGTGGPYIHPNPARDRVTLSFPTPVSAHADCSLMNMAGQVMPLQLSGIDRSADGHELDIPLTGLPPGYYALRIMEGSRVRTLPLVKE